MSELIDFLNSKGVSLSSDQKSVLSRSEKSTLVIPLLHQRVVSIKGVDTEKFLQGQLTCDLKAVFNRGSSLGAHCNIKGHMISLFRLLKISDDEVWMRMNHDICDTSLSNLKKYIVFSKAEATEISDQLSGIGISGPGSQTLVERLFEQSPSEDNGVLKLSNGIVVRVPGDRFEIWMQTSDLVELIAKLPDEVALGSTDQWILSEIDAAIPDLREATQESFIPQMTNLQALEGVSFAKGCYTGQEIVTRLQHRGVLKKPMYLAEASCDGAPQPGQKIQTQTNSSAGEVVLSAPCDENSGRYRFLAVINKKAADEETLNLADSNSKIEILELPYKLDPELFNRKDRTV
jgi:folate-binding protein YgfZ